MDVCPYKLNCVFTSIYFSYSLYNVNFFFRKICSWVMKLHVLNILFNWTYLKHIKTWGLELQIIRKAVVSFHLYEVSFPQILLLAVYSVLWSIWCLALWLLKIDVCEMCFIYRLVWYFIVCLLVDDKNYRDLKNVNIIV